MTFLIFTRWTAALWAELWILVIYIKILIKDVINSEFQRCWSAQHVFFTHTFQIQVTVRFFKGRLSLVMCEKQRLCSARAASFRVQRYCVLQMRERWPEARAAAASDWLKLEKCDAKQRQTGTSGVKGNIHISEVSEAAKIHLQVVLKVEIKQLNKTTELNDG